MNSRRSELAVGVFVIIFAIALFFLAMKVSGLVGTNLKDSYTMTATFNNVSGIKKRAKVTMSGVTVGRVTDIQLDPVTRLATVNLELDGRLTSFDTEQLATVKKYALEELQYTDEYKQASTEQQKEMEKKLLDNMTSITNIDNDAYIAVATNGLLGEKYLKIVPGGGLSYLKRDSAIPNTQGTMDLEDLISKFVTNGGASKLSGSDDRATEADKATSNEQANESKATDSKQTEPSFIE